MREKPGYAVKGRAALIPNEYLSKARTVDEKYNNTPSGQIGPMQQALKDKGGVHPIIFGAYGDTNDGFNKLLSSVAEIGSTRLQAALGTQTQDQARLVLLWQLRRKMAAAVIRANMDCLQLRMGYLGNTTGYGAPRRRRQQARRRFFGNLDPSEVTAQFRNSFSTYPGCTRGEVYH